MSAGLDPAERRRILTALDRIEERLHATHGIHSPAGPAASSALEAAGLPAAAALVWAQYDGISLAAGEACLLAVGQIDAATAVAAADGLLQPGDRVVGERGREVFVLPEDPWSWGADVLRITEDGERDPEASSVAHLLLGWIGEMSILYDDQGEFRDDAVDEWGELAEATARKLLRRRLDLDPDAPRPRLDLARVLVRGGDLRAASREVDGVLRRAPDYPAALELAGRIALRGGDAKAAVRAFERAAEAASDPVVRAQALAWAAHATNDPAERSRLAKAVIAERPKFAHHQLIGARAQLERGSPDAARELVDLGLAVAPTQLELLELRGSLRR